MSGFRYRLLAVAAPLVLMASSALAQGVPWHLDVIDQCNLPWDGAYTPNGTGAGVHVYILGTGIDHSNPEFEGRASTVYSSVADPSDTNGHGTWVASLVGGRDHGVAKEVSLHALKVIDECGYTNYADTTAALHWIMASGERPAIAVIPFSFPGSYSSTFANLINDLRASGVTTVVAAGDEANDACNNWPGYAIEAITVGAHDSSLTMPSWSAHGSCIDIFAPGESVTASWLSTGETRTLDSTASSAAIVAGALATLLGDGLSSEAARTELINAACSEATLPWPGIRVRVN